VLNMGQCVVNIACCHLLYLLYLEISIDDFSIAAIRVSVFMYLRVEEQNEQKSLPLVCLKLIMTSLHVY